MNELKPCPFCGEPAKKWNTRAQVEEPIKARIDFQPRDPRIMKIAILKIPAPESCAKCILCQGGDFEQMEPSYCAATNDGTYITTTTKRDTFCPLQIVSGDACPKCGEEMQYGQVGEDLAHYCPDCKIAVFDRKEE